MKRVFVTGGSGFIGTNLLALLRENGWTICNADLQPPRDPSQRDLHVRLDLLDAPALRKALTDFAPTHAVHLAARTDLQGRTPRDYRVNTAGTIHLLEALEECPSVQRVLFASTKLVCRTGLSPRSETDFQPDTAYGESKAEMERILRSRPPSHSCWCIVRPTSIWGPWYAVPYHRFFLSVARGRYVHPGRRNPPRSFGYVENSAFQILRLLEAPDEAIREKVFYLSDYEEFTIREWAEAIADEVGRGRIPTVPSWLMRLAAAAGDVCQSLGWSSVPISSFRLRNMWSDTTHLPLENTRALTGPLPFSMRDGVRRTIAWMRREGLLRP